jgi:hypothetical protein
VLLRPVDYQEQAEDYIHQFFDKNIYLGKDNITDRFISGIPPVNRGTVSLLFTNYGLLWNTQSLKAGLIGIIKTGNINVNQNLLDMIRSFIS